MLGLFPPTPILSDVRDHPRVEDRLTVTRSVVATVQAQDRAGKIDADALGDVLDVSESLDEERGFVAVARSGDEGSNHVAMAIAEGDDLAPLVMLVAVASEVVAALLGGGAGAVAVDHADV